MYIVSWSSSVRISRDTTPLSYAHTVPSVKFVRDLKRDDSFQYQIPKTKLNCDKISSDKPSAMRDARTLTLSTSQYSKQPILPRVMKHENIISIGNLQGPQTKNTS